MARDQAFQSDSEKLGLDISPVDGEKLQQIVASLYTLPTPIVERAKRALAGAAPEK
jgi:hypothetical protein